MISSMNCDDYENFENNVGIKIHNLTTKWESNCGCHYDSIIENSIRIIFNDYNEKERLGVMIIIDILENGQFRVFLDWKRNAEFYKNHICSQDWTGKLPDYMYHTRSSAFLHIWYFNSSDKYKSEWFAGSRPYKRRFELDKDGNVWFISKYHDKIYQEPTIWGNIFTKGNKYFQRYIDDYAFIHDEDKLLAAEFKTLVNNLHINSMNNLLPTIPAPLRKIMIEYFY